MSWLDKIPQKIKRVVSDKKTVPEGLWHKCVVCQAVLYRKELEQNADVCPKCSHHHRIGARVRLNLLLDEGKYTEFAHEVKPVDALKFKDTKTYKERLNDAQQVNNEEDALIVVEGQIHGLPVVVAVFEFGFMGGSMGAVVGERFVRAVQRAVEARVALVCFAASGGARMQEGLFSLLQMAKTSAALTWLSANRLPFISVLTDPTMGGVSASFAMLGDVVLAEPQALIGFAGPRVIEQTVRETLPSGFQRSEFLLEHGAIDMIVDRRQMRIKLAGLIASLMRLPWTKVDA